MANSVHNYQCCKNCLYNVEIFDYACHCCLPENNYQNYTDMNDDESVNKSIYG